jgi:hypothetical protein
MKLKPSKKGCTEPASPILGKKRASGKPVFKIKY